MTTIQKLLDNAKATLSDVADNPMLEAEILLAHTLNKPRSYLYAWPEKNLTDEELKRFANVIDRRLHKEPIAYITGRREFWSLDLDVTPDTLIPRPETELLVETALNIFNDPDSKMKIADLGTGSGAIALALSKMRPAWQICAIDASEKALQIAKKNAKQFELNNILFYQGNWCEALPCHDFDMIISNPPYIAETEWADYAQGLAYEPKNALVSGKDGLDAIREISQSAKHYLRSGGYLLIEHGFLQGEQVRALFVASGYSNVHSVRDLSDQERVTVGCCLC